MEITTMQMYWLVMLDNIAGSLVAILVICGLFFTVGIPSLYLMTKEELFFPITK